jgi:predicted DNA-binding protein YlxM (UPF0122 family)
VKIYKLKQSLLDLVRDFLIDDYSSWQILDLSNLKRQKSKDDRKREGKFSALERKLHGS